MVRKRGRARGRGEAWEALSWRPVVAPVSPAGEYLIAREMGLEMGLVDTRLSWTAWRRSAALPLFRLDGVGRN